MCDKCRMVVAGGYLGMKTQGMHAKLKQVSSVAPDERFVGLSSVQRRR